MGCATRSSCPSPDVEQKAGDTTTHRPSSPPGNLLFRLFLTVSEDRKTLILPLCRSSRCVRLFCALASYSLHGVFLFLFSADIFDVMTGGGFRETTYGKANPIISLISFCASQIGFCIACCTTLFLLVKRCDILQCGDLLEALLRELGTNDEERETITKRVGSSLKQLNRYFALVICLALLRFLSNAVTPGFMFGFWSPGHYATLDVPDGFGTLYAHGTMCISLLTCYTVMSLFAYFSSFLHVASAVFYRQQDDFLTHLVSARGQIKSEAFVRHLTLMRNQTELMNDAFDQVEKTFSVKLLVDLAGNTAAVLSNIAWFSTYFADPQVEIGSILSLLRHVLACGIYLLTIWITASQPMFLYQQHERTAELVDKMISVQQISTREQKPSAEEVALCMSLIHGLRAKPLLFSAGGAINLGPVAISTLLASIVGFTAFVIDRAATFKNNPGVIHV